MENGEAKKKWNKIYAASDLSENISAIQATEVLCQHIELLPDSGTALDLACGLGGNAILLAQHGLSTYAWDISQQAIDALKTYCSKNSISLNTEARDVERQPPKANTFDVICVSYYLERDLVSNLIAALKPKGLLFYQTFVHESVSNSGPKNPKYRLRENELLSLFSSLHILAYQEYGRVGNIDSGLRDVAMLVAQKR